MHTRLEKEAFQKLWQSFAMVFFWLDHTCLELMNTTTIEARLDYLLDILRSTLNSSAPMVAEPSLNLDPNRQTQKPWSI